MTRLSLSRLCPFPGASGPLPSPLVGLSGGAQITCGVEGAATDGGGEEAAASGAVGTHTWDLLSEDGTAS